MSEVTELDEYRDKVAEEFGRFTETCDVCEGIGFVSRGVDPHPAVSPSDREMGTDCGRCGGRGWWLSARGKAMVKFLQMCDREDLL